MSFDAFTLKSIASELNALLSKGRIEKVLQPSKDEIFLSVHKESAHYKLQINAGAAAPRIGITSENPENPKVPPMFCMLLRKHLTGAKIERVFQHGFERVIEIELETYDEMGFLTKRRLICEIMGRYSNAVLCDEEYKIFSALRPVDFTVSSKRQLLPQMQYELPPAQNKKAPMAETAEGFAETFPQASEKGIGAVYSGVSPLTAREIAYRAGENANAERLFAAFSEIVSLSLEGKITPTMILDQAGEPFEFSSFAIKQYGRALKTVEYGTMGELTDAFFAEKERRNRERQRSATTEKLLKNIENRLIRKMELQRNELKDTEKKSDYKKKADLITANIYRFKGKSDTVTVIDYEETADGGYIEKEIELKIERGLTPVQYAQKLYKKYNKAKNAEIEISAQLRKGEAELEYIRSVQDALSRISGQGELDEIRRELEEQGYVKKTVKEPKHGGRVKSPKAEKVKDPLKFVTGGGFTVLVGKNNIQNDYLTFKIAAKNDYWFHVKNMPGSHVILLTDGREPTDADLTEAAVLAAKNSKAADQERAEVDYTRVKNVKKPSGAKPGFVIYEGYNTAIVSPKD